MIETNILLGVTGSVAAIKTQELIHALRATCATRHIEPHIRVILTNTAEKFVHSATLTAIDKVFSDQADWTPDHVWTQKGDAVLHIELRKWANVLLIAPLSAHTMAKISSGLCDTLLTSVCRAWDLNKKPLIVCPAMNTLMYEHPLTDKQLRIMKDDLGVLIVPPEEKTLACGDVGVGAMRNVQDIARIVVDALQGSYSDT